MSSINKCLQESKNEDHKIPLTFPKVHSLEHVSLGDPILLGSAKKLGDLLHLFEGHGWAGDLLYGFVSRKQTVNQFAQNLGRQDGVTDGRGGGIEGKNGTTSLILGQYNIWKKQVIKLTRFTHTSVFQPGLESQFAWFWLSHTGATLTVDPLHQDLLQLRIILAIDLILNLPTQAVGWTFVSHANSLRGESEMKEGGKDGIEDGDNTGEGGG